jgi:DDE superfamily endonuclease.
MDLHASHITPKILSKASDNGIHLVIFPSHTTHLLQPLDAGVYRPLQEGWRKEVEKFLTEHPGAKPDCYDFNRLVLNRGAFQSATLYNSFAKTGLFTFYRGAISR